MLNVVTAVYENGILRPLAPLPLLEHQTVQLQILETGSADEAQQLMRGLAAAGLLTPPPCQSAVEPVSETDRRGAAAALGQAASKPLSQVIIEERGEW